MILKAKKKKKKRTLNKPVTERLFPNLIKQHHKTPIANVLGEELNALPQKYFSIIFEIPASAIMQEK
jgi:hypothetical protein